MTLVCFPVPSYVRHETTSPDVGLAFRRLAQETKVLAITIHERLCPNDRSSVLSQDIF